MAENKKNFEEKLRTLIGEKVTAVDFGIEADVGFRIHFGKHLLKVGFSSYEGYASIDNIEIDPATVRRREEGRSRTPP